MSDDNNEKKDKNGIGLTQPKHDTYTFTVSGGNQLKPVDNGDNERVMNVPAMALGNVVVFPFALSPLMVNDADSIKAVECAMNDERFVAIFPEMGDFPLPPEKKKNAPAGTPQAKTQVDPDEENDGIELDVPRSKLYDKTVSSIGVLVRIVKMLKFPDGTVRVLVRGLSRVRFVSVQNRVPCTIVRTERIEPKADNSIETMAMVRNAVKQFQEIITFTPNYPEELKIAVANLTDSTRLVDLMADTLNITYREKLAILTIEDLQERLHLLTILLNREVEVLRLGSEIQSQVHDVMSKQQREFFLREQLKQIKEELGEGNRNPDVVSINERLAKINVPDAVREIINKEVERLDMIPQASGEYNIAYTYIDWLLSVPWDEYTEDRLDVLEAARILDEDHYGLKDVKERILEFLSVLQLKKNRKSPIICFVGPPGVGKTSLGKSIASAMGRKFVRMSLGGIRDEAEIRGHRRTYIGALPGRIIQGMKKAGSSNPVFMLDELDKLASDQRGDPASALLEVLDPQQNFAFNDHYLEVDYDLSSVMFIATANLEEMIPRPLHDRMEMIRLPGYTAMEKHEIAKRYLVPRQMKENGLSAEDLRFKRSALDEIITYYTMEAGVRNLERTIGTVCRKLARKIVEGKIEAGSGFVVTVDTVQELLGPRKFIMDQSENIPQIGVVTGMAWTSVGGSTLQVEATKMPGKGDLRLTGSLGDVMKESAMAAFSYVRSHSKELGIDDEVFTKYDFHIHVPDGATPKDGPSAGVTLTTALVSLLTGKPVRPHLSMTGEITLRGKVTAIGGVKEKVIAALRAGISDIIMPADNEKDLHDVPDEVKSAIRFHFVSHIDEVLKFAIPKQARASQPNKLKTADDEIYTFVLPLDEGESAPETPAVPEEKPVKRTRRKKADPEKKTESKKTAGKTKKEKSK